RADGARHVHVLVRTGRGLPQPHRPQPSSGGLMRTYRTLIVTFARSTLREPVGLFFSLIFAPMLVLILGLVFGNDPNPDFGGQGYIGATLPAFASLVMAIMGVMIVPVAQLQLRESGALTRLRATPLQPRT